VQGSPGGRAHSQVRKVFDAGGKGVNVDLFRRANPLEGALSQERKKMRPPNGSPLRKGTFLRAKAESPQGHRRKEALGGKSFLDKEGFAASQCARLFKKGSDRRELSRERGQ